MQKIMQKTLKDTMCYRNIPIFIYQINYPSFSTACSTAAAWKINDYYIHAAKNTEYYCRTVLYPLALESARYIQKDRPFNSYTLDVNYKVTYNTGCVTSLYTETYTYMGGAHGETKRTSDTWNFRSGSKLQLNDIYSLNTGALSKLKKGIMHQIAERLKETPGSYFDDYETLLQETFSSESFYLLPDSFVLYFQQYDIAPYSSGMPEFSFLLRFG